MLTTIMVIVTKATEAMKYLLWRTMERVRRAAGEAGGEVDGPAPEGGGVMFARTLSLLSQPMLRWYNSSKFPFAR